MIKRILNLFTVLVMVISLIGMLPLMTASAGGGLGTNKPAKGYVCIYDEIGGPGNQIYWIKYIYDINGNKIYEEDSNGNWYKYNYDSKGKITHREDSYGDSYEYTNESKNITYSEDNYEYDSNGNVIYWKYNGGWNRYTYDSNGNRIYCETSEGNWGRAVYAKIGSKESMELYEKSVNKNNTNTTTKNNSKKKTSSKLDGIKKIKLKAKKKKLNVSWKKVSRATGYEVVYAKNSKFTKGKKKVKVKKNKVTLKKLKSKKKYFVKVRAYKKENGNTYCGKWSKVVKKRTK